MEARALVEEALGHGSPCGCGCCRGGRRSGRCGCRGRRGSRRSHLIAGFLGRRRGVEHPEINPPFVSETERGGRNHACGPDDLDGGNRRQRHQSAQDHGDDASAREARPVASAVENGADPRLETGGSGESGAGGAWKRPRGARERKQLVCVVGRLGNGGDDEVVAGQLALRSQAACRPPDERVKPRHCARETAEHEEAGVRSPRVGQLVDQRAGAPCGAPLESDRREQDDRPAVTPGDGHCDIRRAQQLRTASIELPGETVGVFEPAALAYGEGRSAELETQPAVARYGCQDENEAERPDDGRQPPEGGRL